MGIESVICFGTQGGPSFDFNTRLVNLETDPFYRYYFAYSFTICSHFEIAGELAHALRFLASVVSQSFIAFGDILKLHKKFLELSGGVNRIFELEELLKASQSSKFESAANSSASYAFESEIYAI